MSEYESCFYCGVALGPLTGPGHICFPMGPGFSVTTASAPLIDWKARAERAEARVALLESTIHRVLDDALDAQEVKP
jgi:hypothetical protein